MGNASCACMSTNEIKVIKNSSNNHSSIMIILNKKEDGMQYLQKINIQFCKNNSLGPFYLTNYEELFSDAFQDKAKKSVLELTSITNYNKYITNPSSSISITEYNNYYRSCDIIAINTIPIEELQNHLIYCTSSVFRLLLYLSILSRVPLANYSIKHISKIDTNEKIKNQIELDLPRTFPNIEAFKDQQFRHNFRTLLYEIADRDYLINYVQGMNFISGFCLILAGNQLEIALILFTKLFSLKSKLFKCPFREIYNKDFPLLMKYVDYFRILIKKYDKEIYNKLVELGINDHIWASKWILTLCLTSFDYEIVLKCWDIIIAKGLDYILLICLIFTSFYKKELIGSENIGEFMLIVGHDIFLDKENQKLLLNHIITSVENNIYNI